jgi:hypothetical protein
MGRVKLSLLAPSGVFCATAAREAGISAALLRRLVADGDCHPLHRGWYSVTRPANEKHRHRLRVMALLQEYHGLVMASHASVVALHDLPDRDIDWGTVHLMWRDPKAEFRAFSRVHIHERIDRDGLRHAPDTVDLALAAAQLGLRSQSSMLVLADHCLGRRLTTPAALADAVASLAGQRWVTRARAALRRLGFRVVRLTMADLASPALVRARIETAIRGSQAQAASA